MSNTYKETHWWLNYGLSAGSQGLELDQTVLSEIAEKHGTPIYVYSTNIVKKRLNELRDALHSTGAPFKIYYAMKANRFDSFLRVIRNEGDIGIDCCSPQEAQKALEAEFAPNEISVTASMLSNRDLNKFAQIGVHLNLDSRSVLKRWAQIRTQDNNKIGFRVDPAMYIGCWGNNQKLSYVKSKFGFDLDRVVESASYASTLGLEVDQLHIHPGWGLQIEAIPHLAKAFSSIAELAKSIPTVKTINIGGGLCWRQRSQDNPLSLSDWANLIRQHLAPTGCSIACESGTYIAASAGVLLAEINTIEERRDEKWIGLNVGHNVNCYAAHYQIPHAIIPLAKPLEAFNEIVNVAGNINESSDIFGKSVPLPHLEEGEYVAFYPAGAYGASMSSNHCMRGFAKEIMI